MPPDASAQPATDVPARFDPVLPINRLAPSDTLVGTGCLSPMTDPRDGTRIIMQRADNGVADYSVPAGRYGVRPGYLLRLECNTGKVVGVVRH
jgi:hypothetical protein